MFYVVGVARLTLYYKTAKFSTFWALFNIFRL